MLLTEHRNIFDQMWPSWSVTTVDVHRVRSVLNDLLGDSLDCFISKTNRPCHTLRRCPLAAKSWSRKIPTSDLFQKLFIVCESSNITTGSQSVTIVEMKTWWNLSMHYFYKLVLSTWSQIDWKCGIANFAENLSILVRKKIFALNASLQFLSVGNRLFSF